MSKRINELAQQVLEARQKKDEIQHELSLAASKVKLLEHELIKAMRDEGIEGFRALGASFNRTTRLNVKKTDEAALLSWLHTHGWESVIKESVHHRTLEKVVTETLKTEGVLPEGVEASEYDVLSVRYS